MHFGTVATRGTTTAAARTPDGWRALPAPDLSGHLADGGRLDDTAPLGELLDDAEVLAPLPHPGKVVCCGLNYGEHIRETGRELPTHPTLFAKYADSLVGPTDDICLPADVDVDWEAELAVVVGATLRRADRATAVAALVCYSVAH